MSTTLLARWPGIGQRVYRWSLGSGLALGFVLFFLLAMALSGGIHVGPDSLTYVRSAMQLFGPEHTLASAQFPPFYPALLAVLTGLGLSWTAAAKCIGMVCFVGALLLVDRILLLAGQRSGGLRLLAALVVAGSYPAWLMYTRMMTEPVFILLSLLLVYALMQYSAKMNGIGFLWLAALCASAAALTRYAGALMIPATMMVVFWLDFHSGPRRLLTRLAIVATGALPFVLWLVRNAWLTGSATGREGGEIIRDPVPFLHYPDTLSQLWLPSMVPAALRITVALVLISITFALAWRVSRDGFLPGEWRVRQTLKLLSLLFVTQVGLFLYAYQVDAFLPFERRLLTPMFSLFLLLHCLLLMRVFHQRKPRTLLAVYFVGLIAISCVRLLATELKTDPNRYGYDSPMWRESTLVSFWQTHNTDARAVSNGDDVLWFHTGLDVLQLPKTIDPRTGQRNPHFAAGLNELRCLASDLTPLYYIHFAAINWRDYLPTLPELQSAFDMTEVQQSIDGQVFRLSGKNCRDTTAPAGVS